MLCCFRKEKDVKVKRKVSTELIQLQLLNTTTYEQYYLNKNMQPPINPNPTTIFQFGDVIGSGETASVFEAYMRVTNECLAIKFIPQYFDVRGVILRELRVLSISNGCKHLLKYHSHFRVGDGCYIVTELASRFNFHSFLEPNFNLPVPLIRIYMKQLSSAIIFLHEHKIVHRDVTLKNLLIDKRGNLRLSDYGMCRTVNDPMGMRFTDWGTFLYAAPEVYLDKKCSYPVDWWSAGVVVYRIVTGGFPYPNSKRRTVSYYTVLHNRPVYPSHLFLDSDLRDVTQRLLDVNHGQRLCALRDREIMDHAFFRGVVWEGPDDVEETILSTSVYDLVESADMYRNILSVLGEVLRQSSSFKNLARWKIIEDTLFNNKPNLAETYKMAKRTGRRRSLVGDASNITSIQMFKHRKSVIDLF